MKLKRHKQCHLCGSKKLHKIIDFGSMPIAGTFVDKQEISQEKYYPLILYKCNNCGLIQLLDIVPREELFKTFLTSYSLKEHFNKLAKEAIKRFLKPGDLAIEIGSNDGTLLQPLKDNGIDVLGIEPTKHIAEIAINKGLPTMVDYFSSKLANKIETKAKVIFANNVLAHIEDIHDVFDGVETLLDEDGVLIFEVHHFYNLLKEKQFDNVYHEHIYYYSVAPLARLLSEHSLEIVEIKPITTHGGSIRIYAKKMPKADLDNVSKEYKKQLLKVLKNLKKQGKKIIGYGASGRGNVLLNFCGIDTKIIDYIVDESPTRYGKFTPGTHIPVVSPDKFDEADYILIIAWNYSKEIMKKMKKHKTKFIIPFPKIRII